MALISRSTIERIEDTAKVEEVIGDFVDLKKSGANYKGLSPFVTEKSASFMVSPVKQIWKDFSSGHGGNAISFLMQSESMSYPDALEYVANKYNIAVEYDESKESKAYLEHRSKQDSLRPVLEAVINRYVKHFNELPEDHEGTKEVIEKRQYTKEIIEDYHIGFAPGHRFIYDVVIEKCFKAEAKSIGLITDRADKYWDRVTYPVWDHRGLLVGIAGRDVTGKKESPKWINAQDSVLFNKSKVWYGLNFAIKTIVKTSKVYIVEGYNDVIGFQTNGLLNTIGVCGTAITPQQITILKKYCNKVILTLDNDKPEPGKDPAGIKSMLKYIPEFLKNDFTVEICLLTDHLDPDDYVRTFSKEIKKIGLEKTIDKNSKPIDGFKFLLENHLQGGQIEKAKGARNLAGVIATISDESMREIYAAWLSKESKLKAATINNFIKDALAPPAKTEDNEIYKLPKGIELTTELRKVIEKYQLFQEKNQIYVQQSVDPPFYFKSVSNFSISIIQHMQDEKYPMKLLRIKNVHQHEKIFDVHSADINTPMGFDNAVTAHGNYLWNGGRTDFQKLRAYLFDKMGNGRKVDVLGWQPEGFWVWNNSVTLDNGKDVSIDENGIFIYDKTSFYVPSANKIYSNNAFKYEPQKKHRVITGNLSFQNYTAQMLKVHRDHAISGILFTIASMFQDIIVEEIGNFPILFLYGPASSGKDQLAECCQSFYGIPQTAINLEGGVSTIKAQVREFAQFSNLISHLSEYKRGNSQLDGVLKGLWDRRGYKRGTLESHVGTESIPILSSVLMTGNDYPDNEALITRLVPNEMVKNLFSETEIKDFEKLRDMTKMGISYYTKTILSYRTHVKKNFSKSYRAYKGTFTERMPEAKSRMVSNISVMGAFFMMLKDELQFPFDFNQKLAHFQQITEAQSRKLTSASVTTRWWDCFLASMRGTLSEQLRIQRDFKLEGGVLYFQFTNCYNKIQTQWWKQYHDTAPGKTSMMDTLRKDEAFNDDHRSIRMGGAAAPNTSAMSVSVDKLPIAEEIKAAIGWQLNETQIYSSTPATPEEKGLFEKESEKPDLPF